MKKSLAFAKFVFTCGLLLVLVGVAILREKDITTLINKYVFASREKVTMDEVNEYYRDYDFVFVQNTEDFMPTSYQDILNIYYTILNSGKTEFTFYCPSTYEECLQDIDGFANNRDILSDLNNYVHPYNTFSHIETEYDTLGRVTVNIIHTYTNDEIEAINQKLDELYPQLVSDDLTIEDNIRNIHDYIINHSVYDSDRSDQNVTLYKSTIAYGPLFEGHALCGGYTDLMQLFLERLKVKSIRVASDSHIWNALEIGGNWYHLDLTWDDPVASDGKQYLEYTYFLVDTDTLLSSELYQHSFRKEYYPELY